MDTGFAFNLFHYTDHEILNAIILIDLHFQTHSYNETKVIMKRNTGAPISEPKSLKNLRDNLLAKLANSYAQEHDSSVFPSKDMQGKLVGVQCGDSTGKVCTWKTAEGHYESVPGRGKPLTS